MNTSLIKSIGITARMLCITIVFNSLSFSAVRAQPQYSVNFTTSASPSAIPFYSNTNNKAQWLFYHTDFPSAPSGFINKIYFRNDMIMIPVLCNFTDFQIKMGSSSLTALPPGPWITAGMNTTYSASNFQVAPLVSNWIPVVLQTPFYYDNTMNFIVEASHTNYTVGFMLMQANMNARSLFGNVSSLLANPQNYLCEFGFDLTFGSTDISIESVNLSDSLCSGIHPVSIIIKNHGPSLLSNATLNWKINNIAQPPVNWTGSLGIGQSTLYNLGSFQFAPSTSYNFIASGQNPNNLPDLNTSNDTLIKNNIWSNAAPTVSVSGGAPSICLGDTLSVQLSFGGTPPWKVGYTAFMVPDSVQSNTSPITLLFQPTMSGNFNFVVTSLKDATWCSASSLPSIQVQVKPVPSVSLGPDQAVKASGFIFLDAGPGFSNYLWSTGAITQTITIPAHTVGGGPHIFWVQVTNSAGCSAADTVVVDVIDDIGTGLMPGQNPEIKIFPNPSSGMVEIQLPDACHSIVQVNLLSYDGKTVYSTDGKPDMDNRMPLDLSHLGNGVYFIRVVTDQGACQNKLLLLNL